MKKTCISVFLFMLIVVNIRSQSISPMVIASSGTLLDQAGFTIEYTTGETATPTLTVSSNILTQGFHQPSAVSNPFSIEQNHTIQFNAYPNPTYNKINISKSGDFQGELMVSISDISGKVLFTLHWETEFFYADLSELAAGMYILKILDKENFQPVTDFKIQKLSNQ